MTLRSRLAVGLVTISIILVGPLVFAIQSLYGLRDDARELRDQEFAASLLLGRLREGLNDLRRQELALLFSKDSASRDAMDRQVTQVAALVDSLKHFQLSAYGRDIGASILQVADAAPAEYQAALANRPRRQTRSRPTCSSPRSTTPTPPCAWPSTRCATEPRARQRGDDADLSHGDVVDRLPVPRARAGRLSLVSAHAIDQLADRGAQVGDARSGRRRSHPSCRDPGRPRATSSRSSPTVSAR